MFDDKVFQVPKQLDGDSCGLYVGMFHKWMCMAMPRTRQNDISSNLASQTQILFEWVKNGEIDELRKSAIARIDL